MLRFIKKHKIISVLLGIFSLILLFLIYYTATAWVGVPTKRNYPTYIKGVWGPAIHFVLGKDIPDIKKDNINLVSVGPPVNVPSWAVGITDYAQQTMLLHLIKAAKKEKIAVHLAPEGTNPLGDDPAKLSDKTIDDYSKEVIKWARFAEKYGVEYFSPFNEPDCIFGGERAIEWHKKILPEIRKVYFGKIYSKWGCYECINRDCSVRRFKNRIAAIQRVESSKDFDGVMLDLFPPDRAEWLKEFKEFEFADFVKETSSAAEKLNLPIIVGDFAISTKKPALYKAIMPGIEVSEEEQASFTGWYLATVMPYYDGVFYSAWSLPGYGMKGKLVEEVVREKIF